MKECSFCGLGKDDVKRLIEGPAVFICDGCIDTCNQLIGITKPGESYGASDGWVGVDLDGTIAKYEPGSWEPDIIGEPVPEMVERVKRWRAHDIEVRIFTARISDGRTQTIKLIQDWCEKHIGERLPVTNVKDYSMWELYDDRAVQVERNTGRLLSDSSRGLE